MSGQGICKISEVISSVLRGSRLEESKLRLYTVKRTGGMKVRKTPFKEPGSKESEEVRNNG